jgi:hypothetical protein
VLDRVSYLDFEVRHLVRRPPRPYARRGITWTHAPTLDLTWPFRLGGLLLHLIIACLLLAETWRSTSSSEDDTVQDFIMRQVHLKNS